MHMRTIMIGALVLVVSQGVLAETRAPVPKPEVLAEFAWTKEYPRHGEGDVVKLNDGRLFVAYGRTYQDPKNAYSNANDHASADIVATESADGGKTWSASRTLVRKSDGVLNVGSPSFLRLKDGRLAMFYSIKKSECDCRTVMVASSDEGRTWSEPVKCISDADAAYYVRNNARAVRIKSGRILLPVAKHANFFCNKAWWCTEAADLLCVISDDDGKTWRLSADRRRGGKENGKEIALQEPGLVEMKDGRLMMYARSDRRRQYKLFSTDGGDHWTEPEPITEYSTTTFSPVTYTRLKSGDLVLAFNDAADHPADEPVRGYERRWPFTLAVSSDDGKTWRKKTLEPDNGPKTLHCCYFALREIDGRLVIVYNQREGLRTSRVTSVPLEWLP